MCVRVVLRCVCVGGGGGEEFGRITSCFSHFTCDWCILTLLLLITALAKAGQSQRREQDFIQTEDTLIFSLCTPTPPQNPPRERAWGPLSISPPVPISLSRLAQQTLCKSCQTLLRHWKDHHFILLYLEGGGLIKGGGGAERGRAAKVIARGGPTLSSAARRAIGRVQQPL